MGKVIGLSPPVAQPPRGDTPPWMSGTLSMTSSGGPSSRRISTRKLPGDSAATPAGSGVNQVSGRIQCLLRCHELGVRCDLFRHRLHGRERRVFNEDEQRLRWEARFRREEADRPCAGPPVGRQQGILDREAFSARNAEMDARYKAGTVRVREFSEFYVGTLAGRTLMPSTFGASARASAISTAAPASRKAIAVA